MRKILAALVFGICAAVSAHAVPIGNITTVAGGNAGGDGIQASLSIYGYLDGVAVDAAGNIYLVDAGNGSGRIRKITTDGIVHVIAGTGEGGFSGDGGPAVQAKLAANAGIAVDASGNVYFLDANRVRRIDAGTGIITTIAGNDTAGYSGDGGAATAATLNAPRGIALMADGSILVSDTQNKRVRRISGGVITTVAGNGLVIPVGANIDAGEGGPATSMSITLPSGIVADGAGGYFVSAYLDNRIRHVDAGGIITTVAGKGSPTGLQAPGARPGDGGPAINAALFGPQALARDAAGNLYVGDYYSLRKIDTGGIINTIAGTGNFNTGDPAYASPAYIAPDASGNVLFTEETSPADSNRGRLRKVDTAGHVSTLAGATTSYTGDSGPALLAGLSSFARATVLPSGDIYIASNQVVRRIDTSGTISSVLPGSSVAASPDGTLIIADATRTRVQKVLASLDTVLVAGTGTSSYYLNGDGGPAVHASLFMVGAIAFDAAGNVLFTEAADVRKVDALGVISTVEGTGSLVTLPGLDNVPATTQGFAVAGITTDRLGNLYVADPNSGRIRKVDTHGIITTVAGNTTTGFSGDGGPATAAQLNRPSDVAVDDVGRIYIADSQNNRIRVVATDGTISTLAGTGAAAYGDDNVPAATSPLFAPTGLYWSAGTLYVTESAPQGTRGSRLRAIRIGDSTPDAFTFTDLQGVGEATVQQSETLTPTGYDDPSPIAITGGEYSIGCTGTFTAAAGTIAPGQSVCVRHTSSSLGNDIVATALTIGATVANFRSTTAPDPGSVSVVPVSLDFGTIWTNYATPGQDVIVTNTGATPVTVLSVAASADYAITNDCTAALAAGASCAMHVYFVPLLGGSRNATLVVRNTTGNASVPLTGTGERSLTSHYYQTILQRAPDPTGFTFWEGEAARVTGLGANINETWFAMAMSFYSSDEYKAFHRDDRAFVTDLYHTFFNREPDSGGLDYWSGLVTQGMPRGVALASFMFSTEFVNFAQVIFGRAQVRPEMDMVTDFYRGLLGRLPDNDGFSHWLGLMRSSQCQGSYFVRSTANQLSQLFVTSAEYTARNRTDEEFVGDLYNAFLRRGGDLPGVQYWINQAKSGMSRAGMATYFVNSQEFTNRIINVTSAGCLQ
jgi:sugar lactone lactonase YvrE